MITETEIAAETDVEAILAGYAERRVWFREHFVGRKAHAEKQLALYLATPRGKADAWNHKQRRYYRNQIRKAEAALQRMERGW